MWGGENWRSFWGNGKEDFCEEILENFDRTKQLIAFDFEDEEFTPSEEEIADDFVHLLHIVNIDESIALEYGKLKQRYPDFNDNKLWLCATAVVRDLVIVSSDEGYSGIAEIVVKKF